MVAVTMKVEQLASALAFVAAAAGEQHRPEFVGVHLLWSDVPPRHIGAPDLASGAGVDEDYFGSHEEGLGNDQDHT